MDEQTVENEEEKSDEEGKDDGDVEEGDTVEITEKINDEISKEEEEKELIEINYMPYSMKQLIEKIESCP